MIIQPTFSTPLPQSGSKPTEQKPEGQTPESDKDVDPVVKFVCDRSKLMKL